MAGEEQRCSCEGGRVKRIVKPLSRADPSESQDEFPLGVPGLQLGNRHAVRDFRQDCVIGGETSPLRSRDAVEISPGPMLRQCLARIMVDGQVQGHEGPHIGRRQIVREIMSMAVYEVDRPLPQRVSDPRAVDPLRPAPQFLGELRRKHLRGEQLSSGLGSRTGDNQGAVARRHQCPVERGKHLFRASGCVPMPVSASPAPRPLVWRDAARAHR